MDKWDTTAVVSLKRTNNEIERKSHSLYTLDCTQIHENAILKLNPLINYIPI